MTERDYTIHWTEEKRVSEYEVTWSVTMEATDPEDAARQAWGEMEAAFHGGPASVLVVRNGDDPPLPLDMGAVK